MSPDGKTLASGSDDGTICRWDVATAKQIGEPLRGHGEQVSCVAFSPDGETIASGSDDKSVRLWDVATARQIGEPLRGREAPVRSVAFTPDGQMFANGSADGTIRLRSGVPLREHIDAFRAKAAQVDAARAMLADRIAACGPGVNARSALQASVLADDRFAGERRVPALIALGEMDPANAPFNRRVRDALWVKDWGTALPLMKKLPASELALFAGEDLNEVVWGGLTELPADSAARDLQQLRSYAQRAVDLTQRKVSGILDTLARAHWELGERTKAIDVQREAIAVAEAEIGVARTPGAVILQVSREDVLNALQEMQATLSFYESAMSPQGPGEPLP